MASGAAVMAGSLVGIVAWTCGSGDADGRTISSAARAWPTASCTGWTGWAGAVAAAGRVTGSGRATPSQGAAWGGAAVRLSSAGGWIATLSDGVRRCGSLLPSALPGSPSCLPGKAAVCDVGAGGGAIGRDVSVSGAAGGAAGARSSIGAAIAGAMAATVVTGSGAAEKGDGEEAERAASSGWARSASALTCGWAGVADGDRAMSASWPAG